MEDGPARRTRSSTSIENDKQGRPFFHSQSQFDAVNSDSEVFKTPLKSKIKKGKSKSRTPSGHFLSNSVKDIRNFFQSDVNRTNCSQVRGRTDKIVSSESDTESEGNHSTVTGKSHELERGHCPSVNVNAFNQIVENTDCLSATQSCPDLSTNYTNTLNSVRGDYTLPNNTSLMIKEGEKKSNECQKGIESVENNSLDKQSSLSVIHQQTSFSHTMEYPRLLGGANAIKTMKKDHDYYKRKWKLEEEYSKKLENARKEIKLAESKEADAINIDQLAETEGQVMDVKIVFQMFRELKEEYKKNTIVNGEERLVELEKRQGKDARDIIELQGDTNEHRLKSDIMAGIIVNLSEKVKDLEDKIKRMEINNMRKCVVMNGLIASRQKAQCINELQNFFETKMDIYPSIEDVFFLTSDTTSPLVMTLSTVADKLEIYRNAYKVKDLVNQQDRPYFFNDYLPAEMSESKRREGEIYKKNNDDENSDIVMTRKGGRLLIDNQPYCKKIHVPTPKEITSLTSEQLDEVLSIPLQRGENVVKEDSTFSAYTISANSYDMIQKGYIKAKLMLPQAKHIVCIYRIPGAKLLECEDFCDDKETSVGKAVLQWMCKNKIETRAFYVARFTNGKKLGQDRFTCYLKAAELALKKNPINTFTEENQAELLTEEIDMTEESRNRKQRPPPPSKFRGGRKPYFSKSKAQQREALQKRQYEVNIRGGRRQQNGTKEYRTDYSFEQPTNALNADEWPTLGKNRRR